VVVGAWGTTVGASGVKPLVRRGPHVDLLLVIGDDSSLFDGPGARKDIGGVPLPEVVGSDAGGATPLPRDLRLLDRMRDGCADVRFTTPHPPTTVAARAGAPVDVELCAFVAALLTPPSFKVSKAAAAAVVAEVDPVAVVAVLPVAPAVVPCAAVGATSAEATTRTTTRVLGSTTAIAPPVPTHSMPSISLREYTGSMRPVSGQSSV